MIIIDVFAWTGIYTYAYDEVYEVVVVGNDAERTNAQFFGLTIGREVS